MNSLKQKLIILFASTMGTLGLHANYSITSDFTFASKYVFRGLELSENTFHPSVEVASGDFYAGIWAALPTEKRKSQGYIDEYDFYAGYGYELSDVVAFDMGATYYYLPAGGHEGTHSLEGFVGANFTTGLISPAVYIYRDFDLKTWTYQGSLGYSIPFPVVGMSLDLSGTVGHVRGSGAESYTYYGADAVFPYQLNDNASVALGFHWSDHDLTGVKDNHLFFTASLTIGF